MNTNQTIKALSRTALVAVLSVTVAACASTGGLVPRTQVQDIDSQIAAQASLSRFITSQADFPQIDWWTNLNDPQLNLIMAEALLDQPKIDAVIARVDLANAQLGVANQADRWQATGSARVSGVQLPESMIEAPVGGGFNLTNLGMVQFSKKFDIWGGNKATQAQLLDQVRAAQVDVQSARLAIAANIAKAYVAVDQAYAQQDIAIQEKARNTALRNLASARARKGLDNELQVRNFEMAIAKAEGLALAADQQIQTLKHAIAALMGKGPDRASKISRPHIKNSLSQSIPSVLPSELLGHRPDIVAARWRVEASSQGIAASQAEFYPTVNLGGLAGLAARDLKDLFSAKALLLQVGPSISLPLFAQGRLQAQLADKNARYDLAVAEYNGLISTSLREVADALTVNMTVESRLQVLAQGVKAANKAVQIANARYRAGLGTQLDVLNAQRPLLEMEQEVAALRSQKIQTIIDLNVALGGGALSQGKSE